MDKAEIERRARKQVSCEEKAFRIVERLLDNPITEEFLTDVAHYITPSHYTDVVEERGIANQCGYPLCPNQLGSVPKKKFHISTKTNKVYDISQRKNFCSNRCYQASIHFEKQISTSPVWSRDDEPRVKFKLLPLDGRGGLVGDVIISPAMEVKAEYEQLKKLEKYEEVLSHKKEQFTQIQRSDENETHIRHNAESQNKERKPKEQGHVEAFTKHADESEFSESIKKLHLNVETQEKIESCVEAKSKRENVKESENKSLTGLCNSSLNLMTEIHAGNADTSQESKGMTSSAGKSKVFKPKANLSDSVQPSAMSKTEYLMKLLDKKKHLLSKMVQLESLDVNPKSESSQTDTTKNLTTVFLKPDSSQTCLKSSLDLSDHNDGQLDSNTRILVLKDGGKSSSIQLSQADHHDKKSENYSQAHHGDKSKFDLNYCIGNKNEQNSDGPHDKFEEEDSQGKPSVDELICKNTGTKLPHSLEAVTDRGSAKVIETQQVTQLHGPQSTPADPVRASPLALICQNMFEWLTKESIDYLGPMAESSKNKLPEGFHKQYAALAKRLDTEERDFDDILGEETMEERNDKETKPLPDISKLQEETRAFELKVTEFYRGANSSSKMKTKQGDYEGIIVLPTVDNHDQMFIRRKIVMDKLSKVIPELLPPLKLSLQDVFTELKELIATFSLTSKNILYKPTEWMLVCLILLKMLSKKMKALEDSFQSVSSEKYFTILLKGIGESPVTLDHYVVDMIHQKRQSY